jgi:hypothetical protein
MDVGSSRLWLPSSVTFGPVGYYSHRYAAASERLNSALSRISIKLPSGYKLMLHHFVPHRELSWHDHPWDFRTVVLWGGYTDESIAADGSVITDHLGWLSTRSRRAEHAHRTASVRGAVTLVLCSPRRRQGCHSLDTGPGPADWTCED